ncbi:hypothetical protein ACRALDRAFT_213833, partial [Sodiomyces alcalophilus JCM 7366]|uniref:uncharacterized protein n=1 Tax=Sodiomyces alcalophilus JCM 7366 TaxID=591952 RepID=UPI0039B3EA55
MPPRTVQLTYLNMKPVSSHEAWEAHLVVSRPSRKHFYHYVMTMDRKSLDQELDARLDIARKIVRRIRRGAVKFGQTGLQDFSLNLMQLSAFLFSDLDVLRRDLPFRPWTSYYCRLREVESLLAICKSSLLPPPVPYVLTKLTEIDRTQSYICKHAALRRDNWACGMTKLRPRIHHIWPPTIHDTPESRQNSQVIFAVAVMLFDIDLVKRLFSLIYPPDSDNSAAVDYLNQGCNMISLSPKLCGYYRKAFFGLKWVETKHLTLEDCQLAGVGDYAYFQVEWRRLPPTLAETLKERLGPWESKEPHGIPEVDLDCPETIEAIREYVESSSPDSVNPERFLTLKVKRGDLQKTETLIRTQWDLMQMAAFSGAADVVDDLDPSVPLPVLLGPGTHEVEDTSEESGCDSEDEGESESESEYDIGEEDYIFYPSSSEGDWSDDESWGEGGGEVGD